MIDCENFEFVTKVITKQKQKKQEKTETKQN